MPSQSVPPGTVTPAGLIFLAQDYYRAGTHCLNGEESKELSFTASLPTLFLFSHAIELSLKSWMMHNGKSAPDIKNYGHNLLKLLRDSFKTGLSLDVNSILNDYASKTGVLHIDSNGGVVSDYFRLAQIPPRDLKREFLRHFLMLNFAHGQAYLLRYSQTGYFSLPNSRLVQTISRKTLDQVWNSVVQRKREDP
jgi:hypothetical protein